MTEATSPTPQVSEPRPTDVATFRRSLYWFFSPGPGLHIQCRHLDVQGLLATGALPLPVLNALQQWGGMTIKAAVSDPARAAELAATARAYAVKVAIAPRIVDGPAEDGALTCDELGDALLIDLMGDGMTRRMAALPPPADTFHPAVAPASASDRSDGAAVSPSPELLADGTAVH